MTRPRCTNARATTHQRLARLANRRRHIMKGKKTLLTWTISRVSAKPRGAYSRKSVATSIVAAVLNSGFR
eukprot:COSAG06_NODE_670_length_13210_cov_6.810464_5_plen_70_part_00